MSKKRTSPNDDSQCTSLLLRQLLPLPVPIIGATSHICLTHYLLLSSDFVGLYGRPFCSPLFFAIYNNNIGYQYVFPVCWSYCDHWYLECAIKLGKKHNWFNCLWHWWLKCYLIDALVLHWLSQKPFIQQPILSVSCRFCSCSNPTYT